MIFASLLKACHGFGIVILILFSAVLITLILYLLYKGCIAVIKKNINESTGKNFELEF